MKIATLRTAGTTRAAVVLDDEAVLLDAPDVGALLSRTGGDLTDVWTDGPRVPLADTSFATLVPHPNKIVCLGLNYATHITEMKRDVPQYPTLFAKFDGALIGARDHVVLPTVSDRVDWEAELGVVIGTGGRHLATEDALDHVAGYTVINDVTVRDWQHRTREFLSGKTFEATTPVGPWLVTPDELPRGASGLDIACDVDGETVQASNTADLLFDVAAIVSYVSTIITLAPGDVIATGTPGGVGAGRTPPIFLQPGQTLTTRIEAIGELRNGCIAESDH